MTNSQTSSVLAMMAALIATNTSHAYLDGPDPWSTGAPGEVDCTDCHESFPLNSGNGSLSLLDVPNEYVPGQSYRLQVRIEDPDQMVWGFQLTALDAANAAAGEISVAQPAETQVVEDTDRQYVMHTEDGNFAGTADGPVSWTFDWTAPPASTGPVTFYLAGNAGNNDEEDTGDFVYTTTGISGAPTSIRQSSWSKVKLRNE